MNAARLAMQSLRDFLTGIDVIAVASLAFQFVSEFCRDRSRWARVRRTSRIRQSHRPFGLTSRKAFPARDGPSAPDSLNPGPADKALQLSADALSNFPGPPEWRAVRDLPLRPSAFRVSWPRLSSRCWSALSRSVAPRAGPACDKLRLAKTRSRNQGENPPAAARDKPRNETGRC